MRGRDEREEGDEIYMQSKNMQNKIVKCPRTFGDLTTSVKICKGFSGGC